MTKYEFIEQINGIYRVRIFIKYTLLFFFILIRDLVGNISNCISTISRTLASLLFVLFLYFFDHFSLVVFFLESTYLVDRNLSRIGQGSPLMIMIWNCLLFYSNLMMWPHVLFQFSMGQFLVIKSLIIYFVGYI